MCCDFLVVLSSQSRNLATETGVSYLKPYFIQITVMYSKTYWGVRTLALGIIAFGLSACGSGEGHTHEKEEAVGQAEEAVDHAAHEVEDAAHAAADAAETVAGEARESMTKMVSLDGMDIDIDPNSTEANIYDFAEEGTGEIVFILDKIPFDAEGDDEDALSADGKKQLDVLAALMKNHPELKCEIQGHTAQADNALGRTAKKTASGARAAWVQLKLKARGVDGAQLSSKGYADEMLLADLDPKADEQKRLAVKLNK